MLKSRNILTLADFGQKYQSYDSVIPVVKDQQGLLCTIAKENQWRYNTKNMRSFYGIFEIRQSIIGKKITILHEVEISADGTFQPIQFGPKLEKNRFNKLIGPRIFVCLN